MRTDGTRVGSLSYIWRGIIRIDIAIIVVVVVVVVVSSRRRGGSW